MCTLILGRDVVSPATVLLWANRDEDPARPTDPPALLQASPRLVGGRDRRSQGTWLAIRETKAVVAVLNRRGSTGEGASANLRSRGLLVLDVAGVTDISRTKRARGRELPEGASEASGSQGWRSSPKLEGGAAGSGADWPPEEAPGLAPAGQISGLAPAGQLSQTAWERAQELANHHRFGPCTLLFAAPDACWLMAIEPGKEPRLELIQQGWHVITHMDLDDPGEPRTKALLATLNGFRPRSQEEAEPVLDNLLRSHGDGDRLPPVCLHQGRMVTVSASSVWLTPGEARYRHAEGRPCEHPFVDHSALLSPAPAAAD